MAKFWGSQFIQGLTNPEQVKTWTARNFTSLAQMLNGKLTYSDNGFCKIAQVNVGQTLAFEFGDNIKVNHNLGAIPIGYHVIKISENTVVKPGTSNWTTSDIYLNVGTSAITLTVIVIGG